MKGNGSKVEPAPAKVTRGDLITIPLADILAQVDAAGDGLDREEMQVVETLRAMDTNGDNEISIKELVAMGKLIQKSKDDYTRLRRILITVSLASMFFMGVLLCLVVAGVEATKESHTSTDKSAPTLVDLNGKVIGTASAQTSGPLRSDLPFDTLAAMSTLRLVSEPGNVTHFFKISGFERDPTGLLTLYTHQGLASTLYVKDDEVWMTGEKGAKIVLRKKGRRLLADDSAVTAAVTVGVGGGCSGEASAGAPCTQVTQRQAPAITNGMCICKDEWEFAGQVFRGGVCGNPDGDPSGQWCLAESDTSESYGGISACRGSGTANDMWDYCRTTPATRTKAKCACLASWSFSGQTFNGTCGTPDGDTTPWCAILDGSCTGSPAGGAASWDYCDPPSQSVQAQQALVNPAPVPTSAAAPTCDADKCCEPAAPAKKAKWTFMVYGVSDNNLEAFMGYDIAEMARAKFGSSEDVNMIVIADRARDSAHSKSYDNKAWLNQAAFTTMKTFYVGDGEITCLKDHGEGDMGQPETFVNFTTNTMKMFPAEKYGVIYWNHGIGWHGFGGDQDPGLSLGGNHYDAYIDLDGLEKTLKDSLAIAGVPKFDLIGFDACSMASTVVTSKIAKYGAVLVYSEDTEPGHGWNYEVFKDVVATPELSPTEVAKKIIGGFQGDYETYKQSPVTLTAVDTSKWGDFEAKFTVLLDAFRVKVLQPDGASFSCNQLSAVQTFLEAMKGDEVTKLAYDMVDVGNLITAMNRTVSAPESRMPSVVAAADAAMRALQALQPLPMAKSSDRAAATGLGVLFPSHAAVEQNGLAYYVNHSWYGPDASFSRHALKSYADFLLEAYRAGPASSVSLDPPDYLGLAFELPNGMVPSFPFYRNGLRSVKLGCVVEDATAAEKVALGCGDYSIDKWTNTPVSIDIALAFHFEDLRTIPKTSCFYLRTFDSADTTCLPVYMLKGATNSKALTGFTSYYGTTNDADANTVHMYGSMLPGAGAGPAVGPIKGSSTQGPILQAHKDPDMCNGKTMSSAAYFGARVDWDGVSYHVRQRKYVVGAPDASTGAVKYGSGVIEVHEAPGFAESTYATSLLAWVDAQNRVSGETKLVSKVTKVHVAYYPEGNPTCVDKNKYCSEFAHHGQCKRIEFDTSECAKSCGLCTATYYDAYIEVKEEPALPAGCIKGPGYAYCPPPASGRLDYSNHEVSTTLYAKLPGNGWSEVSRKTGTGFVPYVMTSSSKNPDAMNGTLSSPAQWYKDFRLAHGMFFDWDPEAEVSLHRKLRAAELGIGSGRAVLFGVAEDAADRRAVLSSWSPTAAVTAAVGGRKRSRALLAAAAAAGDAAAAEEVAAEEVEDVAAARRERSTDMAAERSITTSMRTLAPLGAGHKHRAHVTSEILPGNVRDHLTAKGYQV